MANIKYKVCVLTLTYANRWQFLEQVLKRVLSFTPVTQVVVVNNAALYNVQEYAGSINDNRVVVLNNAVNMGSAGGYKQALEYAYKQTGADMVWLLDDDNLPDEQALDILLQNWEKTEGADDQKALYSLREDRPPHVKIARGENPGRYYLVPNNFMGFSLFNILKNRLHKTRDRFSASSAYLPKAAMPYVPYGGLLMHRAMIDLIGFPDEKFYLYVDDSEYTYRITKSGGTIWLIPDSKVVDIDRSQGLTYQPKAFHSHLLDQWSFRTYYAVRNRMYFYERNAVSSAFIFSLNKNFYLAYLWIISILSSRQQEYHKFLTAVNDGLKGVMGKAEEGKW